MISARKIRIKLFNFFRRNTVFAIALCAAVITSFIIPPDREYLSYFDFKTLSCLFAVLASVCALKNIRFFNAIARKIIFLTGNIRTSVLCLVYITFIGSMLIANDMALITFLPLGFFVLRETGNMHLSAFVFIMQNIAANLGGMLTPFGNPQNLYLYSKFNIPTKEFTLIMLPLFLLSVAIITLLCLTVKNAPLDIKNKEDIPLPKAKTLYLLAIFSVSIVMVFRILPYYIGLALVFAGIYFCDRAALKKVDYPLLLTFVCFFIFSGNMSRIGIVREFFSFFLEKSTLLFGELSCQFISNVPSAILLSQFTDNYRELLYAVNIGSTGTLISSLASLITLQEYLACNPDKFGYYIKKFTFLNLIFLVTLTAFAYIFLI